MYTKSVTKYGELYEHGERHGS